MKEAVVYYSWTGNTQAGAEKAAELLGVPLIKICEKKERKGLTGFIKSGFQAVNHIESELKPECISQANEFDKLVLMFPIWAGNLIPPIHSFLDQSDFNGKKIILITDQADPKHEKSSEIHNEARKLIEARGGRVVGEFSLTGANPGKFNGEFIAKEIEEIIGKIKEL
ncbi:MAG: hypothetical protein HGA49_03330 [Eubacteriaceae bacterium]|nr:hypothetical protein [Eubacteriaceae bacterium]